MSILNEVKAVGVLLLLRKQALKMWQIVAGRMIGSFLSLGQKRKEWYGIQD
ncbi:hypothetical protein SAMN05428952_1005103 [Nitrosomonas sp. Nm132]|jgi:hypothetical protein|nr:hypothetical protein SAMN05428952_1005103 [Nitrosomonas sp. Nm132]